MSQDLPLRHWRVLLLRCFAKEGYNDTQWFINQNSLPAVIIAILA